MNTLLVGIASMFMSKGVMLEEDITSQAWFKDLIAGIQKWVTPLLVLACAAGAIWAIVLGVKMAQAEDKGKRDEAKQALVNVIIALVAVIALILILNVVGNALLDNPIIPGSSTTGGNSGAGGSGGTGITGGGGGSSGGNQAIMD